MKYLIINKSVVALKDWKGVLLIIMPIAAIAALTVTGVPLTLSGVIVTGAAVIMLVTELLHSKGVIGSDVYWPTLFTGWGILLVMTGLILRGTIPLPLQITGDPLIDTVIVSTLTSVITVTVAFFLPRIYSKVTGKALTTALPFETPYLER